MYHDVLTYFDVKPFDHTVYDVSVYNYISVFNIFIHKFNTKMANFVVDL